MAEIKVMYYIGIDPGISGAMAVLSSDVSIVLDVRKFTTLEDAYRTLEHYISEPDSIVTIEKLRGAPGRGWTSNWTLAMNYGGWLGMLSAFNLESWQLRLVTPLAWQQATILESLIPQYDRGNVAGETQKEKAKRLSQNRRLRKEAIKNSAVEYWGADVSALLKYKKDWDMADALLIAKSAYCENSED